jgi:Tol biopolymer transport system component
LAALALGLLLALVPRLGAQDAPLQGPLLAVDTAQQDRIVIYDMGGAARRELAFGPGWLRTWGFSPDGCRVLYTLGDGPDAMRLYSARLDGTDARALVRYDDLPPNAWSAWHPQWQPGGSRIAFTFIRDTPQLNGETLRTWHIAWVDADGGYPQLYSASGDEHEPQWSPDGAWLAYIAFDERPAGADIQSTAVPTQPPPPGQAAAPPAPLLREADLWLVRTDGEVKQRLTAFPTGSVRGPRWSPDGDLIGFVYSPSPGNDQFYMIAGQPGGTPTQLSQQWSLVLDLDWLPDSSAMLAAARDFRDARDNRLWRIPLLGWADTDASLYLDNPALSYADYPRFSADGRWLAFRSAYALAVVDTLNQSWTLLDEDLPGNTPPVWSPASFAGEAGC